MRIEKNIPVPVPLQRQQRRTYPYADMEVGDSVLFPHEGASKDCVEAAYARKFGQRHGKRFVTCKVEGGVRVWRIA